MSGSGLMDFLILVFSLFIIGAMIFTALDFMTNLDARFKVIAKLAIGGCLVLAFLLAVKGVLFGGAGALLVSPMSLIYFAITVIVILVVWIIIDRCLDALLSWFPPAAPLKDIIALVISALMLIALLLAAAQLLFGVAVLRGGGYHATFLGR